MVDWRRSSEPWQNMQIPYGLANFAAIREGNFFYVDKTPFLPLLESGATASRALIFLRPRRMGKSALVSLLSHYYDVYREAEFDSLFRGLWVYDHPTPEKNKYLILNLNFSTVAGGGDLEALAMSFLGSVKSSVQTLIMRYRDRIPELGRLEAELSTYGDGSDLLKAVLGIVGGTRYQIYLLVDEYDTFANDLLAKGEDELYAFITDKAGFVRNFYRSLKMGTELGTIARIFITGASPILLDDLYTGFNILTNISLHGRFNALAGFTRADVERAVDELVRDQPDLASIPGLAWGAPGSASGEPTGGPDERATLLGVLEQYYNGYRFSLDAKEKVYNSDLVLYFLREVAIHGRFPRQMLDPNARTDYQKLHNAWIESGADGQERRSMLESILQDGRIEAQLIEQFGRKGPSTRDQLVSLLYYTGMLTLSAEPPSGKEVWFDIPNRVIRELVWGHFAAFLKEQEGIELDQHPIRLGLRAMAVDGEIEPFLEAFHGEVVKAMGVKDLRQFSEKALKLMMMTAIVITEIFHPLSEKEFAQGYCDLFLSPTRLVPKARFSWMLEMKYLPATASPEEIEAAFAQANVQLRRYTSDAALVPAVTRGMQLRAGTVVFVSSKDVLYRPMSPGNAPDASS